MTLLEFLQARLTKDELTALAAGDLLEREAVENILRRLSSVYAEHPDYNPSWS